MKGPNLTTVYVNAPGGEEVQRNYTLRPRVYHSETAALSEPAPSAGLHKSQNNFALAFKGWAQMFCFFLLLLLHTGKTKGGICATKSKRVCESDPPPLRLPLLSRAGHIVQVKLWICVIQV